MNRLGRYFAVSGRPLQVGSLPPRRGVKGMEFPPAIGRVVVVVVVVIVWVRLGKTGPDWLGLLHVSVRPSDM